MKHDASLSRSEKICGLIYIPISLFIVPFFISLVEKFLPMTLAQYNFCYYCVNFAVVVWLFRGFLRSSLRNAGRRLFPVFWYAILGYLANDLLTNLISTGIYRIAPGFYNANNDAVISMLAGEWQLMAIGTVILVPVVEEVLYRGVVFRTLCQKNVVMAYLVSMVVFAAIHVIGYIGTYSPLYMVLALCQYLPAGYCLAWCYRQSGTIITPMLMHAIVNGMSIYYAMR